MVIHLRKKICALLLMAAFMAFVLAGCGDSSNGSTAPPQEGEQDPSQTETTAPSGDVNLRFSWWGGDERHEATIKVMEMYAEANPGVTLEGEYGGFDGYLEKMVTQMAANTAPDIMQIDYAYLEPFWGQMDNFVDFNQDSVIDKSGFSQDMLAGVTAATGELIGLPTGSNFSILFANADVAEKFSVDITQQFSWDRLLEEGRRVHDQDSEAYLLYPNSVNRYIFEPYLFNMTGKRLVEDDYTLGFEREDLIKTYEYIVELYEAGAIYPYDETVEDSTPYENSKWLNGQVVMFGDFSSGYDPAMASIPDGNITSLPPMGDSEAVNTGIVLRPTNMVSVNAKGDHVDIALDFLNYFFNDMDAIDALGLVRSVPSTTKALDRMVETERLDPELKAVADWCGDHKGGAGQNIISTNVELETIETDVLAGLYYGDYTPETAADEFIKLMTQKVAELKEIAEKG